MIDATEVIDDRTGERVLEVPLRGRRVTDEMFLAAARVLSDSVPPQPGRGAPLLPPLAEIRALSRRITLAVGIEAQRQGLARYTSLQQWEQLLDARQWEPRYRPMRPQRCPVDRL